MIQGPQSQQQQKQHQHQQQQQQLARAGGQRVRDTSETRPPFRLPKIIHQTVPDKQHLSCQQEEIIATWKKLNPGYEHRLWDDKDMREFIVKHYPDIIPTPYDDLLSGTERSDIWRILVLHKYGGVYADIDVECLRPVDEWNKDHGFDAALLLGVEHFEPNSAHTLHVQNWLVASMPGHPLLALLPGAVSKAIQRQYFGLFKHNTKATTSMYEAGILERTGPDALTDATHEYFATLGINLDDFTEADVNSAEGVIAGGVRILPVGVLSKGWEVAAARQRGQRLTCAALAASNPDMLACHRFWGTWRASWGFKERPSYDC